MNRVVHNLIASLVIGSVLTAAIFGFLWLLVTYPGVAVVLFMVGICSGFVFIGLQEGKP